MNARAAACEFIRARDIFSLTHQCGIATPIDVQCVHDKVRAYDEALRPSRPVEELVPTPINPDRATPPPTVVLWRHDCGTTLAVAAARKPRLCSVCGIGRRGTWCQAEEVSA